VCVCVCVVCVCTRHVRQCASIHVSRAFTLM